VTAKVDTSENSPERASSSALFAKAKRALLRALRKHGIAQVEIRYDGAGDEGQIQDIRGFDAEGRLVPSLVIRSSKLPLAPGSGGRQQTLHENLDEFAWSLLGHYHDGFYDGDGGFGTITIDVAKRTVTLDHDDCFTDSVNTVTEV
jgi:hypothetical protein